MNPSDSTVSLADVISVIEARQPILNRDDLDTAQLHKPLTGIASLSKANPEQLSFLSDKAYAATLAETQAAVVLVSSDSVDQVPNSSIAVVVGSPYTAYASVTHLFDPLNQRPQQQSTFIHPTAQVAESAVLGEQVYVGPFCVIGEQVQIGSGSRLQSHVHIEQQASIGTRCNLYPHTYIAHRCQLGNDVRIYAGASIGSDGFGFAPSANTATEGWERIVQLGRVIIGNQVRIGSQTCIDRGAIDDTVIEDNVIIDNLVQVGHNVKIGAGTAIAGKAGIAGSATIGKRCMIGGGVGIAGHLQICDDVVLTGMTMVSRTIKKPGVYSSGVSSMPAMDWRRAMVKIRALGKK